VAGLPRRNGRSTFDPQAIADLPERRGPLQHNSSLAVYEHLLSRRAGVRARPLVERINLGELVAWLEDELGITTVPDQGVSQMQMIDLTSGIPGPNYTISPALWTTAGALVIRNGLVSVDYTSLTTTNLQYSGLESWEWLSIFAAVKQTVIAHDVEEFSGPGSSFVLSRTPRTGEAWPIRNGLYMKSTDYSVVSSTVTPTVALESWEWLKVPYNYDA
jgi:hypothetical protein